MPRHKKYDWADKKDLCYRLWVEEEKSLPQVQEYFAQALGVAEDCIPSYVSPLLCNSLVAAHSFFQHMQSLTSRQITNIQAPVQGMGLPTGSLVQDPS
jgi:hypothetical protein